MNTVFICSSQEPGKDGVGDYTRHIACELTKKGHNISIIALFDKHINTLVETEIDTIPVLRLSRRQGLKKNLVPARQWIEKRKPGIISLQYVPYGFNLKGLPFQLPAIIKKLSRGSKVHIMFHELWLGEAKDSTIRQKMIGFLQQKIVQSLVKNSGFDYTFVNAAFYADCLRRKGIQVQLIPVFNNLPVGTPTVAALLSKLPEYIFNEREKYIMATFFGGTHYHSGFNDKVAKLNSMIESAGKVLVAVHIGQGKPEAAFIKAFSSRQIEFIILGEQSGKDAADFFANIDLGLSTYPKILYQKSGGMASLLNNGLPVILLRDSFEKDDRQIDEVKEVDEIESISDFLNQPKSFSYLYSSDYTVEQYLKLFEPKT